MAIFLIVERDAQMRAQLTRLGTPHDLVCVESAQKAWALLESGQVFDDVIYFEDPIGEALLRAAAVDHDAKPEASDLAVPVPRARKLDRAA